MFGLLSHLVSLLSTGRRSLLALVIWFAYVGCAFPVPGETMLWLTGSCNYMWAITLSLLLIYLLLSKQLDKNRHWWYLMGLIALAVVAGSFNEATSLGVLAGLGLYYLFNRQQFNGTIGAVLMAYAAGIAIIVASPGAWARAADGGIAVNLPLGQMLTSRFYIFDEKMWRFLTPVAALLVGVICLLWRHGRKAMRRNVWTYLFLALTVVMLVLGLTAERAYAAWATVALIIVVFATDWVLSRTPLWCRAAVVCAGLALMVFSGARARRVIGQYADFEQRVTAPVIQIKENNLREKQSTGNVSYSVTESVQPEAKFQGYSRFVMPVCYQSSGYFTHEVALSRYYELENLQFVPDSVLRRYRSGRLCEGAQRIEPTCDRPDLIDSVLTVPSAGYMLVFVHQGCYRHNTQQARYYLAKPDALKADEVERRRNYGLVSDYTPRSFYPLFANGCTMLLFPMPDNDTGSIGFSTGDDEVTLTFHQ